MGKKMLILVGLVIFLLFPNLLLADCLDLGGYTSWYAQGGHTIIFYQGVRPMASVDLPYCSIRPESSVRLIKNYVCDADYIIVDGDKCTIGTISSSSFGGGS